MLAVQRTRCRRDLSSSEGVVDIKCVSSSTRAKKILYAGPARRPRTRNKQKSCSLVPMFPQQIFCFASPTSSSRGGRGHISFRWAPPTRIVSSQPDENKSCAREVYHKYQFFIAEAFFLEEKPERGQAMAFSGGQPGEVCRGAVRRAKPLTRQ
ncbi:unnamed protein product, partial [Amoebophrya sp. A120]|eukprot:GSA120T00000062001.1